MQTRLTVSLESTEREALYRAAQADMRSLRDQARWLLKQALVEYGHLESEESSAQVAQEVHHD